MQNPRPSYAHHQLQQHLSSLLSAAGGEPPHPSDDDARAAALSNLRLAFLHPPNRPLLPSIAPFLAPPLSVLLADDASYAVRRAAVSAYGTLCAVLCSHEAPGGLPDGFVAWALPLLGDPSSAPLVAEGLRELLATGDAAAVERFVPPLLAACRDVLEDERTSLPVLRCLLGLLILIAAKFPHCFRPQFVDIMDLLLGWAFVPDLADVDRNMIMDSFSKFQWHWLGNLQFALGLLPKFLADMEVLLHDPNLAASHNSGRLRPLFACFSTVLQIMASGVAERNNLRDLVAGPLEGLAPQLLRCAAVIASKLGWSERMEEASKCLVLLAEILQERFAEFYVMFVEVLAKSLELALPAQLVAALKTNQQIFSMLHKLSNLELSSNISASEAFERGSDGSKTQLVVAENKLSCECKKKFVRKYGKYIVQGLNASSSMSLKLEALDWIDSFEKLVQGIERDVDKVLLDKLSDPDSTVKNAFLRLFSIALPITTYAFGLLADKHSYQNSTDVDMNNHCTSWRHVPAVKQQPRKLHWQQLVSILSYLSLRLKLPLSPWVQRLVFSYRGKKDTPSGQTDISGDSDGNELSKGPSLDRTTIDKMYSVNNLAAVWWGIHEAARHCINLRLRTHLGGPTQTFAALERMLLDVTNVLTPEAKEGEVRHIGPSDVCLLPMRLLLDFVEALKKYAYNAYEGSFVLAPPPKASAMFFRANKRVCEEWFSRICDPMLNAGLAMQCSDAVVHYCSLRLLDLRNLGASSLRGNSQMGGTTENHHAFRERLEADVLKVLRHASLALCRCHETDALIGLQKWAASTFYTFFEQGSQLMRVVSDSSKHFSWMSGLIFQSQGQYEKAAAHYSHLLQSEEALASMKSDGIQYIIERVIECYTSLSDWKCLESWLAELQVLRAVHAGKPYSGALTSAGNELNAIHAMACFDEGDFHSAWGYLDLTPKSSSELSLDPKVALERSEVMLLRAMLQSDSKSDRVREELDKAKLMLGEALSVVPLNGLTEAAACAGQLHCIFAFEEASGLSGRNEHNQSQVIMDSLLKVLHDPIDSIHQDCSMWLKVFKVYRHTQPSSLPTLLLCQKLASLARKQCNFMLASRLNQYLLNHPLNSSDDMGKEILELNIKYEGALLKHQEGNNEEALSDLWSLSELSPDRYHLTDNEKSEVEEIIRSIYAETQEDPITPLIEQATCLIETAAGAPGSEAREGEDPSAVLKSDLTVLLCKYDSAKGMAVPLIDKLIGFWWSLRQRRVSLFGHAAHAYFQCLSYSSTELQPSYHRDALKGKTRSYTLRALLYLLHIMLNYSVELNETLERGLSTVPLLPWQDIIPQLFARLSSHPEKIARKLLESILLKLGKLSPCSIVYPTLVDINACEGEPSEELQHILDFLVKLYPNLVKDVKLAIEELGTITVLWEEQWLSTLQDLHSDVLRRINVLKEEAARVAANSTLSAAEKHKINAAKYSAMMTPIIVALERRLASTSREPKTSHEMWFHKEYNAQLKSAITALKTPPGSPAALGEIWRPFDSIAASLATHQRKSCILLSEIAPQLAVLSTSDIPMPGFEKQIHSSEYSFAGNHGTVTVSSFCKEVTILSTKTRPKKLVLQGSDGQRYTYLLKGREDLRLDSRIMQLLEAINSLLYSSSDTRSRNIAVRFYSVTPVSGRAGLIQWVENVSSIYNVYKSWQKRSQLARAQQEGQLSSVGAGNAHNPVPPVPRPSDMFYGKIIPALKEKGIKRVVSRRDWPLDVKRKVLLDLMKETPKQILWQEMWCASEGFRNFNSKVNRFSSSVAAMSIVGHMLGLGDRHLDNILMDFSNGDVVHIDYNICFDKGKRLKIPEIVPFRLTQTIESALGLTGVEGVFRVACEAVMGVLVKNKDIILMLLEVFIWDPLIEWTRGNIQDEAGIAGEEKKGMELAVSLSLFSSRIQEIRVPLQEHQDLFITNLPATLSALKKFLYTLDQYEVASAMFYTVEKERSSALQNETSAKSVLADATSVAEKSRTSFERHAHELAESKAVAIDEANKLAIWVEKHGRVLQATRDNSITRAESCMQLNCKDEALSLISAVALSGVPLTVVPEPTRAQCYELDMEVSQLISELHGGLSSALDSLSEYALILQQVLPVNYITTSPITSWAQVLQLCVSSTSQDMLTLAKRQAAEVIAKVQGESINLVQQRYRELLNQMESYVACMERLARECSELMNSIGSDIEVQSKERILSVIRNSVQLPSQMKDGDNIHLLHSGSVGRGETKGKDDIQGKVFSIFWIAVGQLYSDIRAKVLDLSTNAIGRSKLRTDDAGLGLQLFDQQIEKCTLVSGVVDEVHGVIGNKIAEGSVAYAKRHPRHWASTFQAALRSSINIIEQMTEVFLPEFIRSFVSCNSEVMEAIGSISQIRGSVDTALEKLIEVELDRASLTELEQSYFVKVGRITEQQIALEEAAARGREHLSWEEAEELASQEEVCRAQLEQLQETWNQKDLRISSLMKVETSVMNSLRSSKQYLSTLLDADQESEFHLRRSMLLSCLTKPFADLESIDNMLSSHGSFPSHMDIPISNLKELLSLGSPLSDVVWPSAGLLKDHAFFVWEISFLDSVLDLCMREISSSVEHSFTTNQLYSTLKKKLAIHVEKQVFQYMAERITPVLIQTLDEEINDMLHLSQGRESDQPKRDSAAVGRVTLLLEEYCNAHETARAARTTVSVMKRQLNELTEALRKIILEVVQFEWLHDLSSPHSQKVKVLSQNILTDDKFISVILHLSRNNLLDKIQSSVSLITRSIECLQACESTSISAEGQLERAMGWACGGSNTSGASGSTAQGSGIPPEFHDHLSKRKKLLRLVQEEASNIVKFCSSVLEFEASRDGLYFNSDDKASKQYTDKGRAWQQTFLNLLTRLDAAYHSFTCAEQEWKLGQLNLEAAGNGLFSANNQVSIISGQTKTALVNLQDTLVAMYESACEVSTLLSGFKHVSQDRAALTSECGSLLEEVLAIADGLHDVYILGKEASAANMILFPLEASLSADVTVMSEAISKEKEKNNATMPLIHGKALHQTYSIKIREACKLLEPLVGPFTEDVKELHSMVTKLGRLSSIHAGNLHKALEVHEEPETVKSQDVPSTHPDLLQSDSSSEKDRSSSGSREGDSQDLVMNVDVSLQDGCWISPPEHSYTSSSGCNTGLTQISSSENLEKIDAVMDEGAGIEGPQTNSQEEKDSCSNEALIDEIHDVETHLVEGKAEFEDNNMAFKQVRGQECDNSDPKSYSDSVTRVNRGKNPFALSILKQVEHKLHGWDIDSTRSLNISEQVDHLIKQSTSIDNLCNMEGW
ncbi:hypothetical protein EJB05_04625, partial [Eragrostis curvula]